MLFSIISAHTSEINRRELDLVVKLINSVFPQSSALSFKTVTDDQFEMCCSLCTTPSDLMFTFWVKVITAFFAEEESYVVNDEKYFVIGKTKIKGKRYMLVVSDDFEVELWHYTEDQDGLARRIIDMTDDIIEAIICK